MKYSKGKVAKKSVIREQPAGFGVSNEMKRLTIDVSAGLHSSIKVGCARKGVKMSDAIREILKNEFGEDE